MTNQTIDKLQKQIALKKKLLSDTALIQKLPDNGKRIKMQLQQLEQQLSSLQSNLQSKEDTILKKSVKQEKETNVEVGYHEKRLDGLMKYLKRTKSAIEARRKRKNEKLPKLVLEEISPNEKTSTVTVKQLIEFINELKTFKPEKLYKKQFKIDDAMQNTLNQLGDKSLNDKQKMKLIDDLLLKGRRGIEYEKKLGKPVRRTIVMSTEESIQAQKKHEEEMLRRRLERLSLHDSLEENTVAEEDGIDIEDELEDEIDTDERKEDDMKS